MPSLPVYNLVDVFSGQIYPASVEFKNGLITRIDKVGSDIEESKPFLMPGFVDAHIHVESSMLLPGEFARTAVIHGTVATVSDPHEIANVCGVGGVELMLRSAGQTPFKFCFGAPSCVPATEFETSGAKLDVDDVSRLLQDPRIGYLCEVMDFPGVIAREPTVIAKIEAARKSGKPVDGHAPGLRGEQAKAYLEAGITTDHECVSLDEALDKIAFGCKIAIREGSAARNFDALQPLIDSHTDHCMLCSDDKHPDEFLLGHINEVAARAVSAGRDLMNVLRAACVNAVQHYGLNVGLLRVGDPADFIVVNNLNEFGVLETWIDGAMVAKDGKCLFEAPPAEVINQFEADPITSAQLKVKDCGKSVRVIDAIDGQLITNRSSEICKVENNCVVADTTRDLLKIVVVNRYKNAEPAVAFVRGFGMKSGALASSVAHDSHNVVAVGCCDEDLVEAVNTVIDAKGGLAVATGQQTEFLPLPVAGLMSTESCESVGKQYEQLDQRVKSLGSELRAPFMMLSFMALLVIPSLKISDKGLFDVDQFEFTSLFDN